MAKQSKPKLGFSDQRTDQFMAAREKVYTTLFGNRFTVNHELLPLVPHIDVYVFEPVHNERDCFTLVTGGMSDQPMTVPSSVPFRRVELILYVDEPKEEYLALLRWLARMPHDQGNWYSFGTTMNHGQPPEPIFPGSALDHFVFMPTIVSPDDTLAEHLVIDGDPTTFLWVVPITTRECAFVQKRDMDQFVDILEKNKHPYVLNETRKSYIRWWGG